MAFPPVIQRELKVASRRRETWRLRIVFGVGAVGTLAFAMLLPRIAPADRGQTALLSLGICGFVLSLLAGPYLTADSISSEKREGTLGLLFLTPLNGWQIVLGKMLTHSLQVGYALLGVLPLLFVPVLAGGVQWAEVVRVLIVLVLTLVLSLSCGLFWSAVTTEARTAVLASALTLVSLALTPWLLTFAGRLITSTGFQITALSWLSPSVALQFAFEASFRMRGATPFGVASGASTYVACVGASLTCSAGLLGITGWLLPRAWQRSETGERNAPKSRLAVRTSPPVPELAACSHSPVYGIRSVRWAHAVEQAPLQWLATRDLREPIWLKAIRVVLFLFFACMLFIAVSTRHWREGYITAFCTAYAAHLFTRVQLAIAATRRLHEDRRNGTLEALLATPMTDREFLQAHHQSLKSAFRRPLLFLLAFNGCLQLALVLFYDHLHMGHGAGTFFSVFWIGGGLLTIADFTTLRWLGLRESLRGGTQMKAVGRALVWLFGGPWLGLGVAVVRAIQLQREEEGAVIFGFWIIGCLFYDWIIRQRCSRWLKPGFRLRVSERPLE